MHRPTSSGTVWEGVVAPPLVLLKLPCEAIIGHIWRALQGTLFWRSGAVILAMCMYLCTSDGIGLDVAYAANIRDRGR